MLKTLQKIVLITAASGLTAFTLSAKADDSSSATGTQNTTSDRKAADFIKQAARDNTMEINLAEAGAGKAQNADLKNFCQTMQQDHSAANQQLQPLAQKYNVTLDQKLGVLEKHEVNRFEKEDTGAKLDQKLATEFLRDHQKAIAKYEKASTDVQASDVKQYIDSTLPKLREHFQHAQTVAQQVGVPQSTISKIVNKTPEAVGGANIPQEQETGASSSDLNSKGTGAKELQPDQNAPASKP